MSLKLLATKSHVAIDQSSIRRSLPPIRSSQFLAAHSLPLIRCCQFPLQPIRCSQFGAVKSVLSSGW